MVKVERRRKRLEARQMTAEDFASYNSLTQVAEWVRQQGGKAAVITDAPTSPYQAADRKLRVWIDRNCDVYFLAHPGDWIIKRRKKFKVLSAEEFEQRYDALIPSATQAPTAETPASDIQVLALNRSEGRVFFLSNSRLLRANITTKPGVNRNLKVMVGNSLSLCDFAQSHSVTFPMREELQAAVDYYIASHREAFYDLDQD